MIINGEKQFKSDGILTFEKLINWGYDVFSTRMSLSFASITSIPDGVFEKFPRLEYLSINGNDISRINSNMFKGLSKLKNLVLEFNSIKSIENDSFVDLVNLELLSLNNNELNEMVEFFMFDNYFFSFLNSYTCIL